MHTRGFTLIELIVAMAILGILAAIAIPSYMNYTHSANRSDATRSMTITAQALERCYSQSFTYVGCTGPSGVSLTGNLSSSQGYYTLTVAAAAANYTITATPAKSPQTGDSACAKFILTNAGAQSAFTSGNSSNTQTCWGST